MTQRDGILPGQPCSARSSFISLVVRMIASMCDQIARLRREGHEVILVTSAAVAAGVSALGLSERPSDLQTLQRGFVKLALGIALLALVVGAFLFLAWSALSLPATFSVVASSLLLKRYRPPAVAGCARVSS